MSAFPTRNFQTLLKTNTMPKIVPKPNLDLLYVQQLEAAPFCGNYASLYFDAKHLGIEKLEGGEIFC